MLRTSARLAVSAALVSLVAGVAAAEIYRWTDKDGAHFTTDLNSVPPAHRAAAKAAAARPSSATVNRMDAVAPAAPEAGPAPSGGRSPAAKAPEVEKVGAYTETQWRERAQKQRSEIEQLEEYVERCKDIEVPARYNIRTGRRIKQQHYQRWMDDANRCSRSQSDLGVKRRQLENFLESARRRGVPPGWLR